LSNDMHYKHTEMKGWVDFDLLLIFIVYDERVLVGLGLVLFMYRLVILNT